MESEIKAWILKAMLAARKPVTDAWLRNSIVSAFIQVAFTSHELKGYIAAVETSGYISGLNDDVLGKVWALTPEGKIKAQQL
jgi:hypothetical protein